MHVAQGLVVVFLVFLASMLGWFVRVVLTDRKRLDALEMQQRHREETRLADREVIKDALDHLSDEHVTLRKGQDEIKAILMAGARR